MQVLRCHEAFKGATWSALLLTYVRATVRERMHVGALCVPLIDLALHHPPYTLFGTGSCRSGFCLQAPRALAPSTKVGQIESLGLCQTLNVHIFLVCERCEPSFCIIWMRCLGEHFRGCRSNFMTALCACP